MDAPDGKTGKTGKTAGVWARLYWMCIGNAALIITIFLIIRQGGTIPAPVDGLYWGTILSLVVVRYLDIRHLGGETADGTPATLVHWRKYARNLFVVSLAAWGIAHWIGKSGA